jgi:tetratricopeptide (TPR) repeat protein
MTEQIIEKAKDLYVDEKYDFAAQEFLNAEREFRAGGNELRAAEMANNRSVACLKNNKPQEALDAVAGTYRIFEQAGEKKFQAMALGNEASAFEALGKFDQALDLYQQSSLLLKELGEIEMRSYVLKNISAIQMRKGKKIESLISMDAALEHQKKMTLRERFLKKLLSLTSRLLNR